jgi:hypothetical protein
MQELQFYVLIKETKFSTIYILFYFLYIFLFEKAKDFYEKAKGRQHLYSETIQSKGSLS